MIDNSILLWTSERIDIMLGMVNDASSGQSGVMQAWWYARENDDEEFCQ